MGVAVGSHKLHSMDSDQENIQVSRVILHKDYDSFNIFNDICLLELEKAVTMGPHVGTIGFPRAGAEYKEGTMCTVTGWGTTSEGGNLANTLQKVSSYAINTITAKHRIPDKRVIWS